MVAKERRISLQPVETAGLIESKINLLLVERVAVQMAAGLVAEKINLLLVEKVEKWVGKLVEGQKEKQKKRKGAAGLEEKKIENFVVEKRIVEVAKAFGAKTNHLRQIEVVAEGWIEWAEG